MYFQRKAEKAACACFCEADEKEPIFSDRLSFPNDAGAPERRARPDLRAGLFSAFPCSWFQIAAQEDADPADLPPPVLAAVMPVFRHEHAHAQRAGCLYAAGKVHVARAKFHIPVLPHLCFLEVQRQNAPCPAPQILCPIAAIELCRVGQVPQIGIDVYKRQPTGCPSVSLMDLK